MKYLVLFLSLSLFACSTTQGLTKAELNQAYRDYIASQSLENKDKISSFNFRGWQTLTDDFLILSSSPQKKYLVEINGFCDELKFAQALILNRSIASSLQTRFDSISTPKWPNLKCFIKSIYPIDKQQAKEIAELDDQASESSTENLVPSSQS